MNGASVAATGLDHPVVNLGVFRMSYLRRAIAAAALSLATLAPAGFASAADMAAKAKPIIDVPFFFVIDNRVTYSYIFSGTDPGMFTVRPNGTIDGKTEKQVFSFTHFDAWAYGTNFFTISLFKSGHNDPASPCTNAGTIFGSSRLRRRDRNIWPVPQHVRLQRDLQHQGLQRGAAA
jgi:hypothetical protein